MTPEDFATMLAKAIKAENTPAPAPQAEVPVQKAASLDEVQNLIVSSFAAFSKEIDAKISKATEFSREGVGRKGTVASGPESERDSDPFRYIVRKAKASHDNLDQTDKTLLAELTLNAIREGMINDDTTPDNLL